VITTRNLTRRFGTLSAVEALSVEIASGEIFGLVGRNGAGKTTTIKMLTTLLPPSAGSASIAGLDIVSQAPKVRRIIGYVPQALSADGELTGYENLLVFARLYDIPRAERRRRIAEALSFMDLEESADRLVGTYSGGMIRRLEIAQSTLHRPKVLFLDEPTVGLDPLARHAVWDHLKRLNATFGSTIVVTTHYMEEAEALCGRVGIMHRGTLAAVDSPRALRVALGPNATLDDAFAHFTESSPEQEEGRYADTSSTRRTAGRLG
jgi:ABC-2 type transport system ATP-binding protein